MSTKLFTIEGNLGADPVIKTIPVGKKVCNFSIASNDEWIDEGGNKQKKVTWHNVECWDKNAIACEKNLTKGSKVTITGPLKINNWTDKEGNERFSKIIIAREVSFASKDSANNENSALH